MNSRVIQPELLDELPATDPRAVRSRQDLQRINAWMGNATTLARGLCQFKPNSRPVLIVELGSGDGNLLLCIRRRLPTVWALAEVTLIDCQELVSPSTITTLSKHGWKVNVIKADVVEWIESNPSTGCDVVLANLFLHHFGDDDLRKLFQWIARNARMFVATEPSRSRMASAGVRLLPVIGCNDVTRHDALLSVRAGFAGTELSELWPP